jgi:hypothetical protein
VPDEFIAEVIIGIQTPQDHKEEIIQIASAKNIPVFQAVKVPFKFLIDRVQVA